MARPPPTSRGPYRQSGADCKSGEDSACRTPAIRLQASAALYFENEGNADAAGLKAGFALDARLDADSEPLMWLGLCELRLMNDRRWPWLILVPQRAGIEEMHDLTPLDQAMLTFETNMVAQALKSVTGCTKINTAALGNIVRQLHVHVIARNEGDGLAGAGVGPWHARTVSAFGPAPARRERYGGAVSVRFMLPLSRAPHDHSAISTRRTPSRARSSASPATSSTASRKSAATTRSRWRSPIRGAADFMAGGRILLKLNGDGFRPAIFALTIGALRRLDASQAVLLGVGRRPCPR